MLTFFALFREGRASVDQMEDHIAQWKNGESKIKLHAYLGITEAEYQLYCRNRAAFAGALEKYKAARAAS